jgi:hypothetical protein
MLRLAVTNGSLRLPGLLAIIGKLPGSSRQAGQGDYGPDKPTA